MNVQPKRYMHGPLQSHPGTAPGIDLLRECRTVGIAARSEPMSGAEGVAG